LGRFILGGGREGDHKGRRPERWRVEFRKNIKREISSDGSGGRNDAHILTGKAVTAVALRSRANEIAKE